MQTFDMSIISGAAMVEEAVAVSAPVEDVWRVFTATERWHQWLPGCVSVENTAGKPWTAGWRLRCVLQEGKRRRTHAIGLADCAPEREAVLQSLAGPPWQLTLRFMAEGTGTRMTCTYLAPGGGRGFFLLPMPRVARPPRGLRETMRGWLEGLKKQAEAGG